MTAKRRRPTKSAEDLPGLQRLADKFTRLLHATGHSRETLVRAFADSCAKLPPSRSRRAAADAVVTVDLVHVLTHWYTDPHFLDPQGNPRPLPLRGAGASIAALVDRINPTINAKLATEMLMRARALMRRGNRYTPTGRKVILDPRDIAATARSLLVLEGYIDTVNGNLNRRPGEPGRLEATAINPLFPVAALDAFKNRLMRKGNEFLAEVDTEMRRAEERATPSSPRARVGVGLFLLEGPHSRPDGRAAPRKTRR